MITVKTCLQNNKIVIPIPQSLNVKAGSEFIIRKETDGSLVLTPTNQVPDSLEKLFKDLQDWENTKPTGEETW